MIGWYVILAFLAWGMWGAGTSLGFSSVTGINITWPALVLFLCLTSLVILGYSVFRSRLVPLISGIIIGVAFLAWYGFAKLDLLGAGIFILLCFESYRRTGLQIQRIKINLTEILSHGLYPIVIGIFILISFAVYQSPLANELEGSKRLPSQTQEFFRQVTDKFLTPHLDTASPKERQYAVDQVASQAYQQINNFLKPYFKYAPPLVAFALFLVLWGLSWFFVWMGVGVGSLLFWVLKKTKAIKVEEKEVKAQVMIV